MLTTVAENSVAFCHYKYWKVKRKNFQSMLTAKLNTTFVNDIHSTSLQQNVFKNIDECIKENKYWAYDEDIFYITFNLLWNSCFGLKVSYNSAEQQKVQKIMSRMIEKELGYNILAMMLNLKRILPLFVVRRVITGFESFMDFLEQTIFDDLHYDEAIWDYDNPKWNKHFLEIKNNYNKNNGVGVIAQFVAHHRFSDRKLSAIYGTRNAILAQLTAFISAGIDTTRHTTEYGLLLLTKNTQLQEKIYNELVSVYGENDKMLITHQFRDIVHKIHYLRAFIQEIVRLASVGALGIPHYALNDIEVDDYVIPKHALIIANLKYCNTGDKYWRNQTNGAVDGLCVDLWLDDKKEFKASLHKDKMVAFSIGDRDCAGKYLALRSLHLIFAKLIMNYKLRIRREYGDVEIKQNKQLLVLTVDPKIPLEMEKRI